MKKLFFIPILLASLSAFSQEADTTQPLRQFDVSKWGPVASATEGSVIGFTGSIAGNVTYVKPDTLRAIVLVTLSSNGIAHARMGFVVIELGKRPVYLDCRKRALKLPMVGWGYELVNPNKKER